MGSTAFDRGQDTLQVEYSIIADDEVEAKTETAVKGMDELAKQKERRRLERAIEFSLSASQGWAVSVAAKGQGEGVDAAWTAVAEAVGEGRVTLRIAHAKVVKAEQLVKVRISIQRLAGGKVLKVNGEPTKTVLIEPRDPSSLSRQMLDDTASVGSPTIATASTSDSPTGASSSAISTPIAPLPSTSEVMSLLRRNYIYFTSLLQEPEAKWRHVSDSQGVTVTQLNSIDPTLTIYRAEATFVGVGVWDVLSTICTPGARMEWDKGLEEATLLEDINELSSLWHIKSKAAWPVASVESLAVQVERAADIPRAALEIRSRSRRRTSPPHRSISSPSLPTMISSSPPSLLSSAPPSALKPISTAGRSKPSPRRRRRSPSSTSPIRKDGRTSLGRRRRWSRPSQASEPSLSSSEDRPS